ncbi:hypothetical protein EON65_23545 [archaeon]|nr:MAG: hypothetical protein EON65_23545 [archaeon]
MLPNRVKQTVHVYFIDDILAFCIYSSVTPYVYVCTVIQEENEEEVITKLMVPEELKQQLLQIVVERVVSLSMPSFICPIEIAYSRRLISSAHIK